MTHNSIESTLNYTDNIEGIADDDPSCLFRLYVRHVINYLFRVLIIVRHFNSQEIWAINYTLNSDIKW